MTNQHPITPPRELVQQWWEETSHRQYTSSEAEEHVVSMAAQWGAALAQPEPQGPTDEELRELRRFHQWPIGEFLLFTISRAVLARWGNR